MVKKACCLLIIIMITIIIHQGNAFSQTAHDFVISYGLFDLRKETVFNGRFEYRMPFKLAIFKPMAGLLITSRGAGYGYAGLNYDVRLIGPLGLSLNFAAGGYRKGPGKELGGVVEFRSGLELTYQLSPMVRMGAAFHHISNASLYDYNPGVESIIYSLILTPGGH
ncbi:MAG: acyloxyacyl hydrolase [Calditrichaeota bacterium]|nr:MAG: acyloxyacyl hydrolase [Calditrichota bacterium]